MPIETVGRKDPALAARMKAGVLPADEVSEYEYVVGRRALKVGEETREPGDPIPEAASWPRLESWLRSGAVVQRVPQAARPQQAAETKEKVAQVRPQRPGPQKTTQEPPARPVLRPYKGASE